MSVSTYLAIDFQDDTVAPRTSALYISWNYADHLILSFRGHGFHSAILTVSPVLTHQEIIMRTSQATLDIPALGNENTAFKVLGAIGFSHFLNDMIQSLLPAIYPLLKSSFSLSFTQIG
ncbi:MAG: hypothetical protein WBV91_05390, partial [Desulfobacterales bacterium]